MRFAALLICFLFSLCVAPEAGADATVLLGEPYGGLARFSPTGHVAVYLDRVCAESPTRLRRCEPGELGVVISRYNKIAGYDWIAIPLMFYLYAVERSEEVPEFADAETVALLRERYRRGYLDEVLSDDPQGESPKGAWIQLIGAAYDRRIYAFQIETLETQDDELIQAFNSRRNKKRFNPLFRNCADFAREMINFYYPKAVRRNIVADAGMTTPKQVAKSLVNYSKKHPELEFSAFIIEQVPGNLPRSKGVRGVLESVVKSKKYAVPLVAVHVWLTPGLAAGYFTTGRFNPSRHAVTVVEPADLERRALGYRAGVSGGTVARPAKQD